MRLMNNLKEHFELIHVNCIQASNVMKTGKEIGVNVMQFRLTMY